MQPDDTRWKAIRTEHLEFRDAISGDLVVEQVFNLLIA
jgi:hypothetical protein